MSRELVERLRSLAAIAEYETQPTFAEAMRKAADALDRLSGGGELVDRSAIIRDTVEEAEQACRYVAKHNICNMDAGAYRDGFESACEVCERAIAEHVARHDDRISQPIARANDPLCERDEGHEVEAAVRDQVEDGLSETMRVAMPDDYREWLSARANVDRAEIENIVFRVTGCSEKLADQCTDAILSLIAGPPEGFVMVPRKLPAGMVEAWKVEHERQLRETPLDQDFDYQATFDAMIAARPGEPA